MARKELTDKQLAELLTKGKTGTIRGFVKNGGGTFDAALTLDDQFKTSFVSNRAILPAGKEEQTEIIVTFATGKDLS